MFCEPYLTSPGACMTWTRLQSASSSSATIMGSPVRHPVPISDRCATILHVAARLDAEVNGRLPESPVARAVGGLLCFGAAGTSGRR